MKLRHSIKSVLAVLALGAAAQASAGQITLNASGIPSYLNNNSYAGLFDARAYLPANFTVNSLSFSFQFNDDTDLFTSTQTGVTTTTRSEPVVVGATGTTDGTSTVTITNTTPFTVANGTESVLLSFNGASFGGATPSVTTHSTPTEFGDRVFVKYSYMKGSNPCSESDWKANNNNCKRTIHYTVTNNVADTTTIDTTGSIALTSSLMGYGSLLDELLKTGKLGFGIQATGDLDFKSASLNIDYSEVPEPGSLALFGIALLGAAGIRRARRA